jgi:outer membrane immunogenic protein
MTTKPIRTGVAIAALLVATMTAQAADLPRPGYKAPAYRAPGFSWTGFYIGLNAGYGWGNASFSDPLLGSFSTQGKGFQGGGTAGYNLQTGSWVWGIEGDIDYSAIKGSDTIFCPTPGCEFRNNWLVTGRGRIGYAGWGDWMPYFTAGAAYGDLKITVPTGGTTNSSTSSKLGWTAGAGVEYAFMGAWSAKAEYLYVDLGSFTCPAATCGPDSKIKMPLNIARFGVNYRF